ncbi:TraB/GumN family protein [Arcobacter sp. LA11]|uniref:TraB/GumN family protein n=1 Tax=Arcobacter sp. LA11 TaxID=1898176 RepID=UPI0009321E8E|nr:TraB/GumN family protein [Arcobacter sp. LA11]
MFYFSKLIIFILLLVISLQGNSSVWKVTKKDGNFIYIGGTIHLLSKEDYPLKRQFEDAFHNSDDIVFEADISKFQTQEFIEFVQEKSLYKNGQTIKDFLSIETYESLESYLNSKRLPLHILKMKPGFLISYLAVVVYAEEGMSLPGVDNYFEQKAKKQNKEIFYLEEGKEQIEYISNMGIGNEENFIKYNLAEMENASKQIAMIRKSWKNGDLELIKKEMLHDFKIKFPKTYEELLVRRNNNWMPKIEKMFISKDIEYVLVGFLHLVGEDSILYKLQKLGYKIEKI